MLCGVPIVHNTDPRIGTTTSHYVYVYVRITVDELYKKNSDMCEIRTANTKWQLVDRSETFMALFTPLSNSIKV